MVKTCRKICQKRRNRPFTTGLRRQVTCRNNYASQMLVNYMQRYERVTNTSYYGTASNVLQIIATRFLKKILGVKLDANDNIF